MVGPITNAAGNGQCLRLPQLPMGQIVRVGAAAMQSVTGLLTPTYRSDFFCVAVRREAWQKLGGLDPVFGLGYYEDFDFSLRLAQQGYQQVIAEDVFVAHVGSASFSAMGAAQNASIRQNRSLLVERHPDVMFEHVRAGNAKALRHLLAVANSSGWTEALRQRAAWRWAALQWDTPRSPLKRLRWSFKQADLRRALAGAGIEAGFPPAPSNLNAAGPHC
jgi:GT2 family glycosyltransferase